MKTMLTLAAGLCCALAAPTLAENPSATQTVQTSSIRETMRLRSQGTYTERGPIALPADHCADATAIKGLGEFPFDNTAADTDGPEHPLCNKDDDPQTWRDVWWAWESTVSGEVTMSTCGLATIDTEIIVYAPGSPCGPTDADIVVCDDQSGCNNQTSVSFLAVAGQTYLVRLGVYNNVLGGTGSMEITSLALSSCAPAQCQPADNIDGLISGDDTRAADNFTALVDGDVTFVCVLGDYNSSSPDLANDSFTVAYYDDAGVIPGRRIAFFDAAGGLVTEGPRPTGATVFGYPQFEHRLQHPPVPVREGQSYWVEVKNNGQPAGWFWTYGVGDGVSYQDGNGVYEPGVDQRSVDAAFCVGPLDFCPFDVDGDGDIDFGDLNSVVSNFNTFCQP